MTIKPTDIGALSSVPPVENSDQLTRAFTLLKRFRRALHDEKEPISPALRTWVAACLLAGESEAK